MKSKLILAAILLAAGGPAIAEKLTNDQVVGLANAGLGDEVVIAKIKASEPDFDLSSEQILSLKARGVSAPIIAAMLDRTTAKAGAPVLSVDSIDPQVPHPSGVYLVDGGKMRRIDATMSNQAKTGGIFGYALTGGIASVSVKASIQNASARVKSSVHKPIFYFFFDESNPGLVQNASAWSAGSAATVTAPSEFSLVRLTAKQDRREARVGSMNIGGAKTGVMDKDRLAFEYELVRPGVYKVMPSSELPTGEYGFIFSIQGGGSGGAMTAKIFDFAVL